MPKIVSFAQPNFQQGPREINAYYLPYSAGVILANALENNSDWKLGELIWRRDSIETTAQKLCRSDVIGFSTYVWNHQYNYQLAERIKQLNPTCTIVVGGPEPAINDPQLFVKNPWMDVVIKSEGEITFSRLLAEDPTAWCSIPGLLINDHGQIINTGDAPRIEDLDSLPSPYLTGLFDHLVSTNPTVMWNGTLETNRGCPYQCTFCDWGSLTYNKVKKFCLDRVFAEMEWIGKNCGFITIADANLGMFVERDSQIIDKLIEVQRRWGRVTGYSMSWAKNQKNEVVGMVKKLMKESPNFSGGLTVSVQSMDTNVLTNIKRTNLEQHKIQEIFDICDKNNLPVYTELILGLPGETEDSWKENFWKIFRSGNHTGINILHAQLLENAEMNLMQRRFYRMETVPIYDYWSGNYDNGEVAEFVDVVIGTNTMPQETMLDVMVWNSFINTWHINGLSTYVARYMAKAHGVDYRDFYHELWCWIIKDPWWYQELQETRYWYQDWITQGRTRHPMINGIELPGWNLHNRSILNVHTQNRLDHVGDLLRKFLISRYNIQHVDTLIDFQKNTILDYTRLQQYPIMRSYDIDLYGFIVQDRPLTMSATYQFDTKEEKTMSPQRFLENFHFARKRNFGKAQILRLET